MMTTRFLQKVLVVVVLLTCTSLLYLNQSTSSLRQHLLPQNIRQHHYTKVPRDYSVKPLVYIFPQYYQFEDNNRLHGQNFTEWVNVKKVKHNAWGLETIRPHESIGFYNGLELQTRQRYAKFLRDYGFHGAVFHHYWFAGRPVMEHVIEAMLQDGEPNIPFMLSWANEPWSARWDGKDGSGILIAQEYGLHEAWRKHFDWLLPFFRHPQYIRSEGKIQFVVYNPQHVGHLGPLMWAAFRQWAVEEGLGGMDIIETRWGDGDGAEAWRGHPPDAINEFHPHVAGFDPARYSSTRRLSRVYHRGTLACWDTTPRHPTDGKAVAEPLCHPKPWQWHLVEMLQKIKSEPNPIGVENFLFVNALNEWGEGNSLEPSAQFGDGYGIAMKNALEISDKEHVWFDTLTEDWLVRNSGLNVTMNMTADVCVIVRTSPSNSEDQPYKLTTLLRSLQAQNNENWRAVVLQTDKAEFWDLDQLVLRALDPRIRHVKAPEDADFLEADDGGYVATDWFIQNLNDSDSGCSAAKYLLVTDGGNTYEPNAFDSVIKGKGDLIGLNVESRQTLWDHAQLQSNNTWNNSCTRLETPDLNLCNASTPFLSNFDLGATFLNFTKVRSESQTFSTFTTDYPGKEAGAWAEFVTTQSNWTYTAPKGHSCQVYHNPAYTSCLKTGNFWFDSPIFDEQGCYTSDRFIQVFGPRSKDMKDIDLQFFRENGLCVKYTKAGYQKALEPPPPEPEPEEVEQEDNESDEIEQDEMEPEDTQPDETNPEEKKLEETEPEQKDPEEFMPAPSATASASALVAPEGKPEKTIAEVKHDDDSEAAKEFAPGAVSSTASSADTPSTTAPATVETEDPSAPPLEANVAKLTGNNGGGV